MTIRERWQRIRAGKSASAGGGMTKTGGDGTKGLTSRPPSERLPAINTALPPPPRIRHEPSGGETSDACPNSARSPNRNFLTRRLTWRFNNNNTAATLEGVNPGEGNTGNGSHPAQHRREGSGRGHRRKPSKYPGRTTPPPGGFPRPQPQAVSSSRSSPIRPPPSHTGHSHHRHHDTWPQPAAPPPRRRGIQDDHSPKKPPHHHHHHPISTASSNINSNNLKRTRTITNPKEKAPRKKKGIRQRQREREREINRLVFGPDHQEHQELLKSYSFPPSPATERERARRERDKKGNCLLHDDYDEGHDGDDEGQCRQRCHRQHLYQYRRKSSNVSPYSSRPASLSLSVRNGIGIGGDIAIGGGGGGGGMAATSMTVGMGGLSIGEMGIMGHWSRDLNESGPWGGFEVNDDR